MDDAELVTFLQRMAPRLDLRWRGLRRVRGQVRKRLSRRLQALGLEDLAAYEDHLEAHPEERRVLDGLCRITITRFHRDRAVWQWLQAHELPRLCRSARATGRPALHAWSAGCASGEEPYTLSLLWDLAPALHCEGVGLGVIATDADAALLARAHAGEYPRGTLKELPRAWIEAAFEPADDVLRLRDLHRGRVRFEVQDLRERMPSGPFDLIFCRNLAFTYFADGLQRRILAELRDRLDAGGVLVVGAHEALPDRAGLIPLTTDGTLWQRA
ncbi:MAG: chemotaxis protein CheR [Myxococcales bacterium]|nr:chemotaxis protein CheR [Myxococcales bacterium]